MPKKHAILIANTEYRDGKLASLAHPGLAYAELAEALKDPARGAFSQVETLVNANLSQVLASLDRFFSRKPADDTLLVYVGAHGFLDAQGELFLALKESDRSRLKSTALMAAVLGMNMDQCPSPHKLLILDCRFHTPYQDGRSGASAPRIDAAKVFAGRGLPKRILLAADTADAPANRVASPAATSATQKLQVVAAKDFTRVLAETFRTPSGSGGRAPFTVEDWWNAAAAELKASKAEPPQRLTVGEPPLTVLRGSSLPRHEMAMSSPGGETVVTMPILPSEPEGDWSRLSGIFPLEMFAPDIAGDKRAVSGEEAPPEGAVGTAPAGPGYIEGADLVLRARQQIESATPADLSDPDAGTLQSPISTSPTLELPPGNPEGVDTLATDSLRVGADREEADPAASEPEAAARRPDATLFFDLRLPPDLSGNSTLTWDSPGDEAAPASAPENPTPLPRTPSTPGPRDTFSGLKARIEAQEAEEAQSRLKVEKEESAQREKLEQWKARWEARTGRKPAASAHPADPADQAPAAPPASAPERPKTYQAKISALQKTLYVPGPDAESQGTPPPNPEPDPAPKPGRPGAPATGAMPPVEDGRATLMVSKDQFLNTGSHKIPTELTPGATIMVSKEDFYGPGATPGATIMVSKEDFYGPGATPGATIMVSKEDFYGPGATPSGAGTAGMAGTEAPTSDKRPARPLRPDGDSGGRHFRRPALPPKPPAGGPGRRKATLWALAALAPVGLILFLFFGARSGLFQAFGIPGEGSSRNMEASRTLPATPPPALPPETPAGSDPAPEGEAVLPPAAAAPAPEASVTREAPAAPAPPVSPAPVKAAAPPRPAAQRAPAAPLAKAPAAPAAPAPAATAPAARPAASAALPADPARIARLQADSLRRAEAKALREARKAEQAARDAESLARNRQRADSIKAAKFTRDSLAVFLALARKDSLKAARAARAEAETARRALARSKADSLKTVQDAAAGEAQLRRSVNQAFKSDTDAMRGLYNRFALGYPGLKGEVVVSLLVAPSGEIERGMIQSSTTGVKMFDQLVLNSVMEWKIRPFKATEPKSVQVAVNFPIE